MEPTRVTNSAQPALTMTNLVAIRPWEYTSTILWLHKSTCTCLLACVYLCTCAYVCDCVCVCGCVRACVYLLCTCVNMCVYVRMCVRECVCVSTWALICTKTWSIAWMPRSLGPLTSTNSEGRQSMHRRALLAVAPSCC